VTYLLDVMTTGYSRISFRECSFRRQFQPQDCVFVSWIYSVHQGL